MHEAAFCHRLHDARDWPLETQQNNVRRFEVITLAVNDLLISHALLALFV